uniref:DYW domain-containing protein n=1 Tax=Glycine max TaxID=3847 RepID=A0A0R0F4E2_SOYBN
MEIALSLHKSQTPLLGSSSRGNLSFSGRCFASKVNNWSHPFSRICCSSMEQRLKPKPKKVEYSERQVAVLDDTQIRQTSSSGLCIQIEKLVVCNRYREAMKLFEILELEHDGFDVGGSTYDALVSACVGLRSIRGVKRVFNYMISSGFEPDLYLMNRVLFMHVKCGLMLDARKLFDEMPDLVQVGRQIHSCALKRGVGDDTFVSCALIDMYSKCGSIEDAHCVSDQMSEKTTVGWNSIIASYALHGYSEEALSLYYEMRDSGAAIDHFTISIVIRICARLASLEYAKQAHAALVSHGYGQFYQIYLEFIESTKKRVYMRVNSHRPNTTLVDFYSKWGRMEDARHVFNWVRCKNVISWSALIAGYGNHGQGEEAVEMFEQMLQEGMIPNHVTFLAVLSACSYSGLSERGWEIFYSMSRDRKVKPRAMHYACLLDEAYEPIRSAPFKPTTNMSAALLTACRMHYNLELGKVAAENLYGMEPEKLCNYIVLLNLYNSSGKLKEAAVDNLMVEISRHGYVEENETLLPDVDEEEQRILKYHSEKLDIAFGLINTPHWTPLQITQGHRVCGDCHSAIKLIAMVTRREIVVRDASKFHHFRNGSCSCSDYCLTFD